MAPGLFRPGYLVTLLYTYGVWSATPEPKHHFKALCISNTPILGIQKHLCWPVGYRGMGAWGATPEPKHHFLALCVSNNPMLGIQKHLFRSTGYSAMGCWSATPEPTQFFLAWCISNTTILGTFSGPQCEEVCVFGAPSQNPHHIFWHGVFHTPPF